MPTLLTWDQPYNHGNWLNIYRRSCPYTWCLLIYGILVGGYAFTIGIGCCGGHFFFFQKQADDQLDRTPQDPPLDPLWAKYWSLVAWMGALYCGSYATLGWNTHYGVQSECSGTFSSNKPGPHGNILKMYGRYRLSGKGSCPERGLETCIREIFKLNITAIFTDQ